MKHIAVGIDDEDREQDKSTTGGEVEDGILHRILRRDSCHR